MTTALTSVLAYASLKQSGALENRAEMVMQFFEEIGGSGTSYDVIRHVEKKMDFLDGESRYRFQQSVLSTVSTLNREGLLKCTGMEANPGTNNMVQFYEINRGDIVPQPVFEKGYKKRYEAALEEIKVLKNQIASYGLTSEHLLNKVADATQEARETGSFQALEKLYFKSKAA